MKEVPSFGAAVRRHLAFLIEDYGFRVVHEDEHLVRLDSQALRAEAVFDPRGEVELQIFRLHDAGPFGRWTYTGMTGRVDRSRLLELAGEHLQAVPAVLAGDAAFFDELAACQKVEADEWTAYYAGEGPRPVAGKLP